MRGLVETTPLPSCRRSMEELHGSTALYCCYPISVAVVGRFNELIPGSTGSTSGLSI